MNVSILGISYNIKITDCIKMMSFLAVVLFFVHVNYDRKNEKEERLMAIFRLKARNHTSIRSMMVCDYPSCSNPQEIYTGLNAKRLMEYLKDSKIVQSKMAKTNIDTTLYLDLFFNENERVRIVLWQLNNMNTYFGIAPNSIQYLPKTYCRNDSLSFLLF